MKYLKELLLILCFTVLFLSCGPSSMEKNKVSDQTTDREYYQLKIYTTSSPEQDTSIDEYLKDAFLPAIKRQGIHNIGVFKLREKLDSIQKTYVLIPYSDLTEYLTMEESLHSDAVYTLTGKNYLQADYKNPPYDRIENILLSPFSDHPVLIPSPLDGPRKDRIYELRSYESPTESYFKNKVDMFNAGGEVKLFDRLGFNAVFYGEVISGAHMPNLMYMTTHADQKSRDANWKAFSDAPEWKELLAMEKYKNNVSHIDIFFLYPTEYSDY